MRVGAAAVPPPPHHWRRRAVPGNWPGPVPASTPSVASPAQKAEPAEDSKPAKSSNLIEIKSPMIGTFYRSPNPDSPSFVEVGSKITQGQTVCIVEAMKLFNEIESEISGTIVKVLLENATPVEYDQPLFLIDPS